MPVITIKQCRLHYLCATVEATRSFFNEKNIILTLTIKKQKKVTQQSSSSGFPVKKSTEDSAEELVTVREVTLPSVKLNRLKFRDENMLGYQSEALSLCVSLYLVSSIYICILFSSLSLFPLS